MALETATVIPRSLNDPVGLSPSFLTKTSHPRPTRALNFGEKTSGVFPSPSEITALHGGRNSRNRSITPLPCFIFASSIDNLLFEINSGDCRAATAVVRSISYAVFCLKKKKYQPFVGRGLDSPHTATASGDASAIACR